MRNQFTPSLVRNAHLNSPPSSSSKAPPPPPSPPRTSTWDFLNPFESFDKYYPAYNISNQWKEERVPELENEEENKTSPPRNYKTTTDHVTASSGGFTNSDGTSKSKLDTVKEIQILFLRASESGKEITEFLEVGKLPYKPKFNLIVRVPSPTKILHLPSLTFRVSGPKNQDSAASELDQDVKQRPRSLSSTLQEILLWEKKLYEEVKVEEKMRILHQRKAGKLRDLDKNGAESYKVDENRVLVRTLSAKIKIVIKVVDRISMKISILRDEELCPLLYEFIHRLTSMWKCMLDCHHSQREAVEKVKKLGGESVSPEIKALLQLDRDLINWGKAFLQWFAAQRSFVQALNNWLLKCLLNSPDGGVAPFSPEKLGAPKMFIVCNLWSQLLTDVSEHDVVDSMERLTHDVIVSWGQDELDAIRRMRDEGDEKLGKEIEAWQKRVMQMENGVSPIRTGVYRYGKTEKGNIESGLHRVFEALEKFCGDCLKVYEEVSKCMKDDGSGSSLEMKTCS